MFWTCGQCCVFRIWVLGSNIVIGLWTCGQCCLLCMWVLGSNIVIVYLLDMRSVLWDLI